MNQDRQWAQALIDDGDERAFRRLYRRHTPRLYQFVLRIVASQADAEDIVQETWVRAVRNLSRFRWQSAFPTWLTGIGLNLCREQLRRRSRHGLVDLNALPEPSLPSAPLGRRLDLEEAIGTLPDGYRAVLVLHDVEGYTHKEIAREMGISEGTSKSQLFHARKAVRAALGRNEDEKDERAQRRA